MIQTVFGVVFFLLAAIWETHIAIFLPAWAQLFPIWPLVVVCVCLDSSRIKLAAGLMLALVWQELARPATLPPINWVWIPLMALASWLLQIWLSHRSLWSALVLVLFGRLVWIMVRIVDFAAYHPTWDIWKDQLRLWASMLLWDVLLVLVMLQVTLFLSKRLAPYLPRFLTRDRV